MPAHPGQVALRRAARRSGCVFAVVGAGTMALGAFMIALHALRLDPSMASAGLPMVLALYAFALLFLAVGALMALTGVFLQPRRNRALLDAVERHPERIQRVWVVVATMRAGGLEGGSRSLRVQTSDGVTHPVMAAERDIEPVLAYLRERAPGATFAPP